MRETSQKRGDKMEIRLAFPNEVDTISQVIEDAKKCLAEAGSTQWQNDYPNADTIIEDIISGQAYVALDEGELLAYAAVTKSPEKAYEAIYDGCWEGREPEYLVFHRIAVSRDVQGQGVAQTFLEGLIEKLGFKQVGKVPVDGERLAYQKLKSNA